jgi:electron transport complex protein RnfG
VLGYTYGVTIEPIKQAQSEKLKKAIKQVVPDFDNDPLAEMFFIETSSGSLEAYPAKKQNELVGIAVKTLSKKGYSGDVWLMVGFKPDLSIIDISVLKHAETPGLGTKMEDEFFKQQFRNKNPETFILKVKKDKGDVDAITAATISSQAFAEAIDIAYNALKTHNSTQTKGGTQ